MIFAQEPSRRLKVQECLGRRGEEPHGVIEGGCAIVAPLIIRKVEGLSRSNMCAIRGRSDISLWVVHSRKGNEGRDESKDGDHHPEGRQGLLTGSPHRRSYSCVIYMHSPLQQRLKKHLVVCSTRVAKYHTIGTQYVGAEGRRRFPGLLVAPRQLIFRIRHLQGRGETTGWRHSGRLRLFIKKNVHARQMRKG